MAFSVNAIDPEKTKSPGLASLFKLIPYLALFLLYNYVPTTSLSEPLGNMPDLGEVEEQVYDHAMTGHSSRMMAQLKYFHALDAMEDE